MTTKCTCTPEVSRLSGRRKPIPGYNPAPTTERFHRFEAKFIPEPNSGCWLWIGGVNEHGYGIFWNGNRLEKAHRFALRAYREPDLDPEADVCHRCDNPACVNPEHLFVGDAQANVDDMWSKQRATVIIRRGTAQTQAKLSDEKVERIRYLYATSGITQYELADMFGVVQSTIWSAIHGKRWAKKSGVEIETGRGK